MQTSETLTLLAEAVADGRDVDWALAESSASTEEDKKVVLQLRALARLGVLARERIESWGPLKIRGPVGSGAYGTVFRAWDARLEREVALKILHSDAALHAASTVIKEGRLLAQIRHPNVVTVHGADEFDRRIGIWMEFVTGRTLRDIVKEQGPFGAQEAALVGRDLCGALAAVHQRGFLHRDVKAQNVMREAGGRTVLMDFGAGDAVPGKGEEFTVKGTPAYLAPELLDGQAPSAKSDIYGLGVLLYFLVSGTFPVKGTSMDDFRAHHHAGHRTSLRDVRADLPSGFVHVVDACTATNPADRPDSAGQVEAMLERAFATVPATPATRTTWPRWVQAAAVVAVLGSGAIGLWMLRERNAGAPSITKRDSVAILPFRNLTASAEDDYLSEGITADLIANLSSLRDLRVIAGSSTRKYADRKNTSAEIGAELSVATVLDASIRRSGDQLRIVAQLIDAKSGEQIWSGSFDRLLSEIVAMKSDVSNQIAVALKGELSQRDMESLRPGRTYDSDAFDLYLKGRHYWGLRNEESINRSVQYFTDALNRDPNFAPAYAGLADAYTTLGVYGSIPREEAYARAAKAAEKAVQLDDSLAEGHASLGLARKNRFEWAAAEQSFTRALELKPGLANAHQWYSVFLTQHGRFAEAIAEIKIAISLDPLSMAPKLQFASLLTMARRYEDAIAQYQQALVMDGTFATAYRAIANAYVYKGDYAQAQTLFNQAREKSAVGAEDQEMKADLGFLFAVSGRTNEALAIANDLIRRHDAAHEAVSGSIAAIYAGLGRRDEAMVWLERAAEGPDPEAGYLLVDPRWDTLRNDPRFVALLKRLGFAVTT